MKFKTLSLAAALLALAIVSPVVTDDRPAGQDFALASTSHQIDFRMTPLEQAKKINGRLNAAREGGFSYTIMNASARTVSDPRHMIVGAEYATSPILNSQLHASTGIDSVSWWIPRKKPRVRGACDSDEECEQETGDMCESAGHGGVQDYSVSITTHEDGSKTCSGDCEENGAVAFVTCSPS